MRKSRLAFPLLFLLLADCREPTGSPPLPTHKTPIPERSQKADDKAVPMASAATTKEIRSLLKGPALQRFQNPGALRWVLDFDGPVTFIRWSPLKGFVVTVGNDVHNITSRGEDRWRQVAGAGHRLIRFNGIEVLFSPAFGRLSEIRRHGLTGWSREWSGRVVEEPDSGNAYLFDASTVAAMRTDGQDLWRVALEGVRKLEGPFACRDGMLVHGMSGLKRVAAEISNRGNVARKTQLGRGALLLSAGPNCEPLVWRKGVLKLLDHRGHQLWKRPYTDAPFVTRLENGFVVVSGRAGLKAVYEVIGDHGNTVRSGELPVAGRLTRVRVAAQHGLDVEAIGLCLDVTNPCAKPSGNRGPFNALLTADGKGAFRTLIRHNAGHLNFTPLEEGGMVVASSKNDNSVDLEKRDAWGKITWQLTFSGRLSAGPYAGPYGGVYLATCSGWECTKPFRLFAVTAEKPEPETDEE